MLVPQANTRTSVTVQLLQVKSYPYAVTFSIITHNFKNLHLVTYVFVLCQHPNTKLRLHGDVNLTFLEFF